MKIAKTVLSLILTYAFFTVNFYAQSDGDYRSKNSGSWSDANTWQRYDGSYWVNAAVSPSSSDGVITILSGHTVTVTTDLTVDQLTVASGGILTRSGGTITINDGSGNDIVVNGEFNFPSGSITGSGNLYITGTMNWSSDGNLGVLVHINATAVLNLSGNGKKNLYWSQLDNYGTVNWSDGDFQLSGTAVFNNNSGALFNISNNANLYRTGTDASSITNNGTFRKSSGGGITYIRPPFSSTGTIEVQSGTLKIQDGSGTIGGILSISSGAQFSNSAFNHTFSNGINITGSGTFSMESGDIIIDGTSPGVVFPSTITFTFVNGTIKGSGKLTVNGTMNWIDDSYLNVTGTTVLTSTATLNITGADAKYLHWSQLDNYGTINWSAGDFQLNGTAVFNNMTGALFNIQCDKNILRSETSSKINNDGTFRKSSGTGINYLYPAFSNTGTVDVQTGTLNIYSTFSNFSSNTLTGGTYNISGTLKFNNADIRTNNADITLNGSSSQILNNSGDADALATFTTNGSSAAFKLENGRGFSTNTTTFTNNGTLNCGGNIFSGSGNFINASGSTIIIGSSDGITGSGAYGNIQNSGTRTFSTSANYVYTGTSAQVTGNGLPVAVNNLTIINNTGVTLSQDVQVDGTLLLTSGDISLNSKICTLGSTATLSESSGNTVKGPSGKITTTRTFNSGDLSAGINVAGLGAKITTASELGATTIDRMHNQAAGNGNNSINRIFKITPTINSSLGATLEFFYDESELGSISENNLRLFKSENGNDNTWILSNGTADPDNNKVTLTGIDGFSYWTLSDINNPLPVELISFTALQENNYIILNWMTVTELNNYGFEIERRIIQNSESGILNPEWKTIGFVKGSGNSNSCKSYSFKDETKEVGEYYYCLKQINTDGSFTYLKEVEVAVENIPSGFMLWQNFPNPFNPVTTIKYSLPTSTKVQLKVYDILGNEITTLVDAEQKPGNYSVEFSAEGVSASGGNGYSLSSGIYFYCIQTKDFYDIKKILLLK